MFTSSESLHGWTRHMVWQLSPHYVALVTLMGIYAISRMETVQAFIYFRF